MTLQAIHFIEEIIEPSFEQPPLLEKTPTCPQAINWRGQVFTVIELLAEWRDYARRGRSARNMQPQHAAVASRRGSWGVGLFYFQVRVQPADGTDTRIFEIYYDRAPQNADHRKGAWYIYREMVETEP